jgi:predicted ATPase/DNA-binding CsgD family transcriptional regulator
VGGSAATAPGGVHGFPAALTSFIGRAGPAREIAALLEQYRLVTVTGPGGSGKTRLAGEVARQMAARFADGVWLAELAPVPDPAQVASAVAAALGVREQPGTSSADTVAAVLARQQLLLVLDNCEHVIGSAADLCARLLAVADDVRIMATSREPLQVAGEARYRLAPLTLPEPGDLQDSGGSEAVALFADRARRADAGFTLDGQTSPVVMRLVTRLDGMPLAIELAAARVEALGVTQLLDRLDNRFTLLAGTDRLAADRHRSLAATVEWSYRLLDEYERRVFRGLSVFPGAFTLEGAEAVVGPGADQVVLHLVDCSLVAPPRLGPDGRSRYLMLETLRAYGAARLADAGEQDQAATALAGYALGVAEEAAAGMQTTTGEAAAAWRLDAEDATTREALEWAMQHDPAVALRLAVALAPWWLLRGRGPGGYSVLCAAADRAEVGSEAWCAAQFWLGDIAFYAPDLADALDHFTAVRDAIGDLGPSRALAACLAGRSHTLLNLGRKAEGVEEGRRSLAMARDVGDPAGQALALVYLSIAAHYAGDFGDGVALARQAEQIPADIPGWIARHCSAMLAITLREAGDLAAAERACADGLARTREVGDLHFLPGLLADMAALDLPAGRVEDAAAHLHEALQIVARSGDWFELTNILSWCGDLCAATGRRAEAVTAWTACDTLIRRQGLQGDSPWDALREEALRAARHALGDAAGRTAEERGAAMSRDIAAEYALMLTAPDPRQPSAGLDQLSAREKELVTLVARGRTDAQIAAQLFISVRTVGSHLDRIRDKTGCRRRADLTRLALSAGLV